MGCNREGHVKAERGPGVIIDYSIQGSPEWMACKVGIPGVSSLDKIITTKGERSTSRDELLYKLAGERIIGRKEETFQSVAMANGIEREPIAREIFEMKMEVEVEQVGFIYYDERKDCGCSPDGLIVGKKEGLEIKCPTLSTHVSYLMGNKLPTRYFQQVQGSLYVTGYESWWFCSWYPDMPVFITQVFPNQKFQRTLEVEMDLFCDELNEIEAKLRAMKG